MLRHAKQFCFLQGQVCTSAILSPRCGFQSRCLIREQSTLCFWISILLSQVTSTSSDCASVSASQPLQIVLVQVGRGGFLFAAAAAASYSFSIELFWVGCIAIVLVDGAVLVNGIFYPRFVLDGWVDIYNVHWDWGANSLTANHAGASDDDFSCSSWVLKCRITLESIMDKQRPVSTTSAWSHPDDFIDFNIRPIHPDLDHVILLMWHGTELHSYNLITSELALVSSISNAYSYYTYSPCFFEGLGSV